MMGKFTGKPYIIFDGKKPWFPVNFPLNQPNEYIKKLVTFMWQFEIGFVPSKMVASDENVHAILLDEGANGSFRSLDFLVQVKW